MLMAFENWLPTRIVFAVSDGWLAAAVITLAVLVGAWKLIVALRRMLAARD
jgi:hypothetical protein